MIKSQTCVIEEKEGNDFYQTLPHNLEAEQSLLSTLMHHNAAYESPHGFLRPNVFPIKHQKIYNAMSCLIERDQVTDTVTLKDFFKKMKFWQKLEELSI